MSFLLSGIHKITSTIIISIFLIIEYVFQCFVLFVTHFIENPFHLLIIVFAVFIIYSSLLPYDENVDVKEIRYPSKKSRKNGQRMSYQNTLESIDLNELLPLYPNGWIPLMESRDLAIGQSVPVTALGHQFVIFRGKTGKSFILDAYCPHLGANLGVCGKVYDDCIQCPFHGWVFSGYDGSCVKIPYTDKVPEFAKAKTWLSIEQNGFIYVWYHADGQQPLWKPPVIPEIEQGLLYRTVRVQHIINSHIQEIHENIADFSHLNYLHQSSILDFHDFHPDNWWNIIKYHFSEYIWTVDPIPNQYMATTKFRQQLSIFGILLSWAQVTVEIKQIGPAIFYAYINSNIGRLIMFVNIIPEGPLRNKIVESLYTPYRFLNILGKLIFTTIRYTLERDICVWNNKKYLKTPLLISEDKSIRKFRKWYSQFYSESSLRLNKKTLNW